IDSIRDCFPKGGRARLISVQPRLMSKFNEWRRSIPEAGAWLVLAEPDRACVALHADGRWRAVQNGKGAWRALLDRERHRDDDEDCKAGGSLRIVNGKIHTMDKKDSVVSSVLIKNGKFAAVGHRRGDDGGDECARTIDLHGRTVVPGIIDSHNHIILLGLRPGRDARLENANSIDEALATLAARAKEAKPNEWVTSIGGFSRNQFFPAPQATRFPTLAELDADPVLRE